MDQRQFSADMSATSGSLALPFECVTPETLTFVEAWVGWRGSRMVPRRSDMQLADIKRLLPMVSLLEVRSPTEVVFRVAGSRMRDYLGFDVTGYNYITFASESFRHIRIWRLQQEVTRPCGALFIYPHRFPSGYVSPAETISLPIVDGRPGKPPMMLTVVTPLSTRMEDPPENGQREMFYATEFAFVDIGAGVPDRTVP